MTPQAVRNLCPIVAQPAAAMIAAIDACIAEVATRLDAVEARRERRLHQQGPGRAEAGGSARTDRDGPRRPMAPTTRRAGGRTIAL